MDLQITVFLLFALFAAGQSFSCYQCTDSCTQTTCIPGFSNCLSLTTNVGGFKSVLKSCAPTAVCPNGSVNTGSFKASSYCCNTDLCNTQNATDPETLSGLKCYYCEGQNCSKTLSCSGTEDRCFTERGNQTVVKGCVSKSFCNLPTFLPILSNYTCCEGNLCNSAKSVSQSFLFLCASLISFIILR